MFLVVGLGNPGKKYERTRHNIGSRVVDELKLLNLENVVLAKPTTFMNESGKAVKSLIKNYKPSTRAKLGAGPVPYRNEVSGAGLKIKNLIVIHDDIDLPLGTIKIAKNRGAAGHKGVQSIIDALGTKDFVRFRIGIRPKQYHVLVRGTVFVLQKFTKEEEKILKEVIKKTAEAMELFLKEGLEKAQSTYNICDQPST